MTNPDLNIPLLRKTVEWAEAEARRPDQKLSQWAQERWHVPHFELEDYGRSAECGSAFCIAGRIAFESMGPGEYMDFSGNIRRKSDDFLVDSASSRACKELGVVGVHVKDPDNPEDYLDLFDGENDITDVRRIAELLAGERL